MQNTRLEAAYAAGYNFAMHKIAAETAIEPREAQRAPSPFYDFVVSHPYATQIGMGTLGGLAGAAVGGVTGGIAAWLPGAGVGGLLGAAAGAGVSELVGAPLVHYAARRNLAERERAQGRSGNLPFVVKHPYLVMGASGAVPVVGPIGAVALHHHYKQDLQL